MESTHTSQVLPTELPNQLATRIELTFEKFAHQLLTQEYELNLIEGNLLETLKFTNVLIFCRFYNSNTGVPGSLNDNTLMDVKNEELYKLDNCTREKQECLISVKEKRQTTTEKNKIDIDQILQEKMVIEQEVKLLEKSNFS